MFTFFFGKVNTAGGVASVMGEGLGVAYIHMYVCMYSIGIH